MNFIEGRIEGKVEWHGNGVVVIKECSVLRATWRFCLHAERQFYFVVRHTVRSFKNSLSHGLSRIKGAKQKILLAKQAQTIIQKRVVLETKKQQAQSKVQPKVQLKAQSNVQPIGTLTEIRRYAGSGQTAQVTDDAQAELYQLLPALAGFCRDRWLVLVSPAQRPDVAALTAAGIDPSRVLLVHSRETHGLKNTGLNDTGFNDNGFNDNGFNDNGLKIVEQALRSGTCGAVVAWPEACDAPTLQRLRSAAVAGRAWGVMFREAEKESTQLELMAS